jgi:3-oxoacyl-[acyl-carrier protein] reductase
MRREVNCPDAKTDVDIIPIAADITMKEGRELVLATCPNPDILINNANGPLPGDFRQVAREDWNCTVDANMLTPIFLIRAVVDGMVARGFGPIINIRHDGRVWCFRCVPLQRSRRLPDGSKYCPSWWGPPQG